MSRSYFGKLDEESVKNNFVLIYELLDGSKLPQSLKTLLITGRNPRLRLSSKLRD
jgi:hypothetical protein